MFRTLPNYWPIGSAVLSRQLFFDRRTVFYLAGDGQFSFSRLATHSADWSIHWCPGWKSDNHSKTNFRCIFKSCREKAMLKNKDDVRGVFWSSWEYRCRKTDERDAHRYRTAHLHIRGQKYFQHRYECSEKSRKNAFLSRTFLLRKNLFRRLKKRLGI